MEKIAKLIIDGKTYELQITEGSEGERAIDISSLRKETGLITLDPGYANTAVSHLWTEKKVFCGTAEFP